MILSAAGIYGVTLNNVQLRLREIGMRLAMGQSETSLVVFFFYKELWQSLIALGIGTLLGIFVCYVWLKPYLLSDLAMLVLALSSSFLILLMMALAVYKPLSTVLKQPVAHALRYK